MAETGVSVNGKSPLILVRNVNENLNASKPVLSVQYEML
jgi:hypothetical protein